MVKRWECDDFICSRGQYTVVMHNESKWLSTLLHWPVLFLCLRQPDAPCVDRLRLRSAIGDARPVCPVYPPCPDRANRETRIHLLPIFVLFVPPPLPRPRRPPFPPSLRPIAQLIAPPFAFENGGPWYFRTTLFALLAHIQPTFFRGFFILCHSIRFFIHSHFIPNGAKGVPRLHSAPWPPLFLLLLPRCTHTSKCLERILPAPHRHPSGHVLPPGQHRRQLMPQSAQYNGFAPRHPRVRGWLLWSTGLDLRLALLASQRHF